MKVGQLISLLVLANVTLPGLAQVRPPREGEDRIERRIVVIDGDEQPAKEKRESRGRRPGDREKQHAPASPRRDGPGGPENEERPPNPVDRGGPDGGQARRGPRGLERMDEEDVMIRRFRRAPFDEFGGHMDAPRQSPRGDGVPPPGGRGQIGRDQFGRGGPGPIGPRGEGGPGHQGTRERLGPGRFGSNQRGEFAPPERHHGHHGPRGDIGRGQTRGEFRNGPRRDEFEPRRDMMRKIPQQHPSMHERFRGRNMEKFENRGGQRGPWPRGMGGREGAGKIGPGKGPGRFEGSPRHSPRWREF